MELQFKCKYCGVDFSNYKDWKEHKFKEHNIDDSIVCKICGKQTTKLGIGRTCIHET